jgi:hypothetical protein
VLTAVELSGRPGSAFMNLPKMKLMAQRQTTRVAEYPFDDDGFSRIL